MRQKSGENKCQVGGNSSGCGTGAAESQTSHFPRQAATDARYVKIDKTDTSDAKIGDGAYGVVYRALDKVLNERVALKRIKLENEEGGIPATALREITLLKGLQHENVVQLKDIVNEASRLYIVFELAASDLKKLMDEYSTPLAPELVRSYTTQMLRGLAYCHSRGIMHRDIKPQNLLVTKDGYLKLADFGLARTFSPSLRPLTVEVITRWYRAPEVMLGCNTYTTAVDGWSAACVIAEMSNKEPFLPGDSEIDQIHKIFKLRGTPDETVMPGVTSLPYWRNNYPNWPRLDISIRLPNLDEDGVDLVNQLLLYDPSKRLSAADALKHPYLNTKPSSPSYILRTPRNRTAPSKHISVDHTGKRAEMKYCEINSKNAGLLNSKKTESDDRSADPEPDELSAHAPLLLEKVSSFNVLTDHYAAQGGSDTCFGSGVPRILSSKKSKSKSKALPQTNTRTTRSSRTATPEPSVEMELPPSAVLENGVVENITSKETTGIAIENPRKRSKK